ncbi:alcohol oxidase [Gymnopus androsaceus JB14]|uniref:Alcohol oxidase n=1 Tax=Gymnopus androsaceus JB14 TaxID=1447944 RepID=A0A6A4GHF5_9AGAR|nr:alcohol oxidase [Gymnopus androsaceus JB14]
MFPLVALSILVHASSLNTALTSQKNLGPTLLRDLAPTITGEDQVFNFVIVGGGTASVTIAAQLAEDSSVMVALIEAGSFYELDNAPLSSTPFSDLISSGLSILHYVQGKTLGGSSARNAMIYQRPTIESLQLWADNVNDQSYNWDNILPYFQKSVHFTPPNTDFRAAKPTADFNPNRPLIPMVHSEQETFLTASLNCTNLKVFDLTMAKKILFDSQNNASGVQVNVTGFHVFNINATKEVIVSAGAFQSPQLLMVSGIGPSAMLETFGIPVIVDNANVGQNMWDHVIAGITFPIVTNSATRFVNDATYQAESISQWETNGTGPLSNNNLDFLAWENIPNSLHQNFSSDVLKDLDYFPSDWPEIEYLSASGYLGNFSLPTTDQPSPGNCGSIAIGLVALLSRGNVTIVSADTNDLPLINPNWLDHPANQAIILAGCKHTREIFGTTAVLRGLAGPEYYPGTQYQTNEELTNIIRDSSVMLWHASATCKMGALNDPLAVVDTHAQVIGVQKLQVVDASSFPILPPGHPQSMVFLLSDALAEKIADNIKLTWGLER